MSTFWQYAFVACGGAIGAMTRFVIAESFMLFGSRGADGEAVDGEVATAISSGIPIATLAANLIGCFLIGVLLGSGLGEKYPAAKYGLGIGFLGALTTFSTFSAESIQQIQSGQSLLAIVYVLVSVTLGFLLVVAGMAFGKKLNM